MEFDEIAALKLAIIGALEANSTLTGVVVGGIHDVNPGNSGKAIHPFVSMGRFSSETIDADCFESSDIVGQIDVYSNGVNEAASTMEALKISGLIKTIIDGIGDDTPLQGEYSLSFVRFRSKAVITAQDGKTKHVAITINAVVDKD